nr:hypothetical protein [Tanacetum cinerariifolium]
MYDKAYNDMKQKIERLEAQLGDLKGKSEDTLCVSDTLDPLSHKLEDENVSLEFQVIPKVGESNALSKPVTLNSTPSSQESTIMNNERVIAPGIFRINPFKASRVENFMPNKHVKASFRTKPTTVSKPRVITKKVYVNGMKSRKKNQSANVSKSENQKKHKANVKKSKKSGSKESLASPSKPRSFLSQKRRDLPRNTLLDRVEVLGHSEWYSLVFTVMNGNPSRVNIKQL